MTAPLPIRSTLRAYAAGLALAALIALAQRWPSFAEGRTGEALRLGWRGGFLIAPVAAMALCCAALWAARVMQRSSDRLPDAARRGQGTRVPLGMAAVLALLTLPATSVPVGPDGILLGAALAAAAFPPLIADRIFHGRPGPLAAQLRAVLLLPVMTALACGLSLIGASLGASWAGLPPLAARLLVGLVAAELALRAAARWFLPPPAAATAAPATDSLAAALLSGALGGGGLDQAVRSRVGLDFSRSFALRYLRAAALPAALGLLLGAFLLSGLKQVPLAGRAVYERFGAPVRVLPPGLHVILPWPMGRLRGTELATVHSLPLGPDIAAPLNATDAEGPADATQDRLWSGTHPNEAAFLIGIAHGFETVSADLRVLWRIGASDADARAAVYATTEPELLIAAVARRTLTHAFASRGLDDVLRTPDVLRTSVLRTLAADPELRRAGIETLDLIVEAVHPPAEASAAYHGVQAAEIASRTEIAVAERAARATRNSAAGEARTRTDVARAHAAEIAGAAAADATRFSAERLAARQGPAFLLERRLAATTLAAGTAHLTLMDASLTPTVDLRPEGRVPATVQNED